MEEKIVSIKNAISLYSNLTKVPLSSDWLDDDEKVKILVEMLDIYSKLEDKRLTLDKVLGFVLGASLGMSIISYKD